MKTITIILLFLISSASFGQQQNTFLVGMAALKMGNYEEAKNNFDLSLQKENSTKYIYQRGIANFYLKKYENSKNDFQTTLKQGNTESYFWLAKIYSIEGDASSSVSHLRKYLVSPRNIYYSEVIKSPYFKNIHATTVWQDFVSFFAATPLEESLVEISYLIDQGKSEEAVSLIDKMLTSNKIPQLHALKGQTYEMKSLYELAILEYNQALGLSENNADYLLRLAHNYMAVKKTDRAIETLEKLIQHSPETFVAYIKLSDAYLQNKQPDEAETYINAYLSYFKNDPNALFLASLINLEQEEFRNALKQVNQLLEQDRPKAEWYLTRGKIYFQTNSFQFASHDISMYLDLEPNNQEANFLLGNIHKKMNNTTLSCYYWKRAQNLGYLPATEHLLEYCNK